MLIGESGGEDTKGKMAEFIMERDFKGIWVPKEIYINDQLNWTEKILFIEIDSLDNNKGCFASNAYFADFIGVSETRISKSISHLKELNLIYQDAFNGRERTLHSNLKMVKQTCRKVQGSHDVKFKHSSIVNKGMDKLDRQIQAAYDLEHTEYFRAQQQKGG